MFIFSVDGLARLRELRKDALMNPIYTKLSKILCIFCASSTLVACSYFDTSGHGDVRLSKDVIDLADREVVRPEPINIRDAVDRSTDGRVRLFDLNGVSAPLDIVSPVPAGSVIENGSSVVSNNPSVVIFPFDDAPLPVSSSVPAAAPAPAVEAVSVHTRADNAAVVYFSHGRAGISSEGLRVVDAIAGDFHQSSGRGIIVEGHASSRARSSDLVQREVSNLRISSKRALAVAGALIRRGVPAEAIQVISWGDTHSPTVLDGKTSEEAARRVEISR